MFKKILLPLLFTLLLLASQASATTITVSASGNFLTNWTWGGSTAKIKIYANQTFITSQGVTVHEGTSQGFYKIITCTVAGTVVSCPSFTIDTTTDSSMPTATFTADVYSSVQLRDHYMVKFKVPTSLGGTVTWEQLRVYNAAAPATLPNNYYTATQTDSAIASAIAGIALGSNIPSLANTYSNSLPAAITGIGATKTTLLVNAPTTLTVPVTIPSNITLKIENGATITETGIGSVVCAGKCVNGDEIALFVVSAPPLPAGFLSTSVDTSAESAVAGTHGFTTGQLIRITADTYSGSLSTVPAGLSDSGLYYAIVVNSTTIKFATSYANALAGTAVNLTSQGAGTIYVRGIPLAFTGADYPDQASTELFWTGTNSSSDRLNLLTRAFEGKVVRLRVSPRVFDKTVLLADKHSVLLLKGVHQNTFAGTFLGLSELHYHPWVDPFSLGSDAEFTSEPGATFMESSVNYYTALISFRPGARNSRVHHNYFLGQGALFDGVLGGILIGGGFNNHVDDNFFDTTTSYTVSIVPGNQAQGLPSYSSMKRNIIKNTATQVLFIGGCDHCDMVDNVVTLRDWTPSVTPGMTIVDLEPNGEYGTINDLRIERNRFDVRGFVTFVGGSQGGVFSFIRGNVADTPGFSRITIKDNDFVANENFGTQAGFVSDPIELFGTDDFEISNNRAYGITSNANFIVVAYSRRGRIFDNRASNGSAVVALSGVVDTEVFSTRFVDVSESGATQAGGISEAGFGRYPLETISGADVRLRYSLVGFDFRGAFYKFYKAATVYINDRPFVVSSVIPGSLFGGDTNANATMTASITGMPSAVVMTVPSTDINTGTDALLKVAHGYNTGAVVNYEPGTGAIVGIANNTFRESWVIRVDADHFKLASSYNNAIAGIADDLTNAGTGTQTFVLTMALYSQANDYHDNPGQLVTLGPHSTSVDRTANTTAVTAVGNSTPSAALGLGTSWKQATGLTGGSSFVNATATTGTIRLEPTNNLGKEYAAYPTDAAGIKFFAPGATIRDGSAVTPLNGTYVVSGIGSGVRIKKLTATSWQVTQKVGTGLPITTAGATLINAIDCGRIGGGTVGGWEEDSLFTGGGVGTAIAYTPVTTLAPAPFATTATYQTYRIGAGASFQYDWVGRDNTKAHLVRLHQSTSYAFANMATVSDMDIVINGVKVDDDWAWQYYGIFGVSIVEYYVPAGTTTVNVTVSSGTFGANSLYGIELYQLP
jgi:hypothetical protein